MSPGSLVNQNYAVLGSSHTRKRVGGERSRKSLRGSQDAEPAGSHQQRYGSPEESTLMSDTSKPQADGGQSYGVDCTPSTSRQ